jgi:hypothetical protein
MTDILESKSTIQKVYFQIEHCIEQRRNTFKEDEKFELTKRIKFLWAQIDLILDQYNLEQRTNHST